MTPTAKLAYRKNDNGTQAIVINGTDVGIIESGKGGWFAYTSSAPFYSANGQTRKDAAGKLAAMING